MKNNAMCKLAKSCLAVFALLLCTTVALAQRPSKVYNNLALAEDWTDLMPAGVLPTDVWYVGAGDNELFLVTLNGVVYRSDAGMRFQRVKSQDEPDVTGKLVYPNNNGGITSSSPVATPSGLFIGTMTDYSEVNPTPARSAYAVISGQFTKIAAAGDTLKDVAVLNVGPNGKPTGTTRVMDLDIVEAHQPLPGANGSTLLYLQATEAAAGSVRSGVYRRDAQGRWSQVYSTALTGTNLYGAYSAREVGSSVYFQEQYNNSRYLTELLNPQTGETRPIHRFPLTGSFGDPIDAGFGRQLPTGFQLDLPGFDQANIFTAFRYYDATADRLRSYLVRVNSDGALAVTAEIPLTLSDRQVFRSDILAAGSQLAAGSIRLDSFDQSSERGIVLCQYGQCRLALKESDSLPDGRPAYFGSRTPMSVSDCEAWMTTGTALLRLAVPPCANINQVAPAVITGITSATGEPKTEYAPGDFLTAYGQYLCGYLWDPTLFPLPLAVVNTVPFSNQIGRCRVLVNGRPAPMHFGITWSPDFSSQVNFLLPEGTAPGTAQIVSERLRDDLTVETVSGPYEITVSPDPSPRPFKLWDGTVIQQDVTRDPTGGTLVSPASPARPNHWLLTYWAGWGPTNPPVKPGQIPTERLATVSVWHEVYTFDGGTGGWARAESAVALTWQFPGVYQLNLKIPENVVVDSEGRAYVRVFYLDLEHYVDFVTYVQR